MKNLTSKLGYTLVLAVLALSLSHCGQKGGLTRPDAAAFTASLTNTPK